MLEVLGPFLISLILVLVDEAQRSVLEKLLEIRRVDQARENTVRRDKICLVGLLALRLENGVVLA